MRLVRFPGGSYKSSADSFSPVKQECKKVLKENGYYYCDWNALNGDAEGKKKDAQGLLDYLKSNMLSGQNVVILNDTLLNSQQRIAYRLLSNI